MKVEEPMPIGYGRQGIQDLRNHVVKAVSQSYDEEILHLCLVLLNKGSKKSRFATHTDEELDELLKDLPDFDSVDHADLSNVDYSNALKALIGGVELLPFD